MRALVTRDGTPATLVIDEVAEPTPAPAEAVVQVQYSGVNRGDLLQIAGRTGRSGLGWDVAGVVAAAAADGSGPRPGTRVIGLVGGGAWAQRVAVHTGRLAVIPDSVHGPAAATLPLAGTTALRALERGGPPAGRRVLVTGASGGVGSLAVQLAAASGAEVTALQRPSRAAGDPAPALLEGVEVVTSLDGGGAVFDRVVDTVGGATLSTALSRLAPGGHAVGVGAVDPADPVTVPLSLFVTGGHLHGFMIFSEPDWDRLGYELCRLLRLHARGELVPAVTVTESWRHAADVLGAVRDRRIAGKVVLRID
jgi:NADPH:quinone reductase-like Zn-dependent oxidoreductase